MKWNMKSKVLLSGFILLLIHYACQKDDGPVITHSRLTRIDYNIARPSEMPNISFEFNDTYDLTGNTMCFISLVADEHASSLNLTLMLEDIEGNKTDETPFIITNDRFIKDDKSHTYSYNFGNNLNSSTGTTGQIDIRRVKKVILYINAGIAGEISGGYFWLDQIRFDQLK